ncbi:MAG: germination protein YpeB [Clostridia bacterium]|nr:germination protein YpeB [Clostridia bacterium]
MNAKKTLAIVIPVLLAAALIGTASWAVSESKRADTYASATDAMYRRTYMELSENLGNLELSLNKLMVTGTQSRMVLLLDDIWRYSGACSSLISQLPVSHADTLELSSFITRVGDYARTLTKKVLGGQMFSSDDSSQLSSLHQKCVEISNELTTRIANGDIYCDILDNEAYYTQSEEFADNEGTEQFPTLIYDGPFSEGVEKAEPKGLTGDEVDQDTALEKAKELIPEGANIEFDTDSDGSIPAFDFTGSTEDGRNIYVSISRQGGHVIWMMASPKSDISGIPDDNEIQRLNDIGKEYLSSIGYENMVPTYGQYTNGAAIINYAFELDGAIVYNDLVKVWIDRTDDSIIGIDARNYLFSHTERDFDEPAISMEEAEAMVSGNLTIDDQGLAIVPITPQTEALCYEFKCSAGDNDYIVYIDAMTGDEVNIYLVIHSEEGTLTV